MNWTDWVVGRIVEFRTANAEITFSCVVLDNPGRGVFVVGITGRFVGNIPHMPHTKASKWLALQYSDMKMGDLDSVLLREDDGIMVCRYELEQVERSSAVVSAEMRSIITKALL